MDDEARGRAAARDAISARDAATDGAPAKADGGIVAFHDRGLSDLMYREYAVRALRRRSRAPAVERLAGAPLPGAANGNARPGVDAPNPVLVGLGLMNDGALTH